MFAWLRRLFGGGASPPALHPLARQTLSLDAEERRQAAEALGQTGEAWAAEPLVPLLGDTHSFVRDAARKGLVGLGWVALPALLNGLNHPQAEVGQVAAELLGELRVPESVEPLLVALKYGKRPVQVAAGRALTQLGEQAVPALTAARDEPQPWVRGQIEAVLTAIRGTSS
jgi:GAF domain-containing protein